MSLSDASSAQYFYQVAVEAPLQQLLTYSSAELIPLGQAVEIPLGKRTVKGVVVATASEKSDSIKIKSIKEILTEFSPLPEEYTRWISWMAQYYFYPPGMVYASSFPSLNKTIKPRKSARPAVVAQYEADKPPVLTDEQETVLKDISRDINRFATHLVFGVTGSGKTEIYLHLLEQILAQGKSGIVLVPEISLTPQLVSRFAKRFGDQVAVLHSQLTDRERTNQWWEFNEGKKKILIGARSALFCPTKNLGLLIVDEEHEPSFKQEEMLKYHGRDAAIMLAKYYNCPIVLGSATPSLETWKNALDGKFKLHRLSQRVGNRAMPELRIVDMRKEKEQKQDSPHDGLPFWLSNELYQQIYLSLEQGSQVALFLNRRGIAQTVLCPACGYTCECPNCDINLTLHGRSHLVCHYCDYHENLKQICPDCHQGELKPYGLGTEKIEEDLRLLFPDKKFARADRDEIQSRLQMEELIQEMESGHIDILIGTQMIAKGLDFPNLKTVGLVLADVGFNLPDFRATERSFQLITQMSGRAGRHLKEGENPGQVLIQTYNPQHESLEFALKNDFEGFAQLELNNRSALSYPPIGKLAAFRVQGASAEKTLQTSQVLGSRCHSLQKKFDRYNKIEILGPAEAPLSRLKGQFRYHLLLKGPGAAEINSFIRQVLGDQDWVNSGVRISVDIDPMNLL